MAHRTTIITQQIRKNATAINAAFTSPATTIASASHSSKITLTSAAGFVGGDEIWINGKFAANQVGNPAGAVVTCDRYLDVKAGDAVVCKKFLIDVSATAGIIAGEAITHLGQTAIVESVDTFNSQMTLDRAITITDLTAITVTNLNNSTPLCVPKDAAFAEVWVAEIVAASAKAVRVTQDGEVAAAAIGLRLKASDIANSPFRPEGELQKLRFINEVDDACVLFVTYFK